MRICNRMPILIFGGGLCGWNSETWSLSASWSGVCMFYQRVLGLHSDYDFGEDLYSMKSNICTFTLRRHTK